MTNDRASVLIGLTTFFTALILIVIMLRVYTRLRLLKGLEMDDYFMMIAVVHVLII